MNILKGVFIHWYMYVCIDVCMHVLKNEDVCMYVLMNMNVFMHICICTYV